MAADAKLSADLSVRPDSAEAEWRSSRPRRMLCNSGVPLVPDCLYQVSGMAYLFGPCMSIFTAMPRPGYLLRMILPVKTQCRRHRRVMEVILLKQKQIKCPYCHALASLRHRKPCVWIYPANQREVPVCLRQMAGLAMPMSVLMSAHCSQWGHWRMAICATNAFWPIVP